MVETINTSVNSDHPYSHYIRKLTYARVLKPGEPGNCTDIAFTKKTELAKQGIHATMWACNLKSGEGHAFLLLDDGRALDNRFNEIVSWGEVGCR
ncbi:transglutaminase-like cysteine peptidase [Bradyrhizobium sp. 1(2017)]|uniref:transglutaminase-like cysteine peptidase n=1 Tax=Bradyrhizobium sp. 1(2017) TaxID=1404888 RepID=UPI00140ED685|nr:transglutaminase-like cysteine peptidase [Bradyrhizobium sp. 1(2017)]QIO32311.1 transglutaminase-like cysteine peptidase [Bradyrhizobium sp. 1(2017)]